MYPGAREIVQQKGFSPCMQLGFHPCIHQINLLNTTMSDPKALPNVVTNRAERKKCILKI